MKYLLITPGYPSKNNIYNNGFIHSRVLEYLENGLDIDIFVVKNIDIKSTYTYEGVSITEGNIGELEKLMNKNEYHKILIHFANYRYMKTIINNRKNSNIIIWVHGYEALGWYRRLFLFNIKDILAFGKYILVNIVQLRMMRRLINEYQDFITFVFVSNWMKSVLEKDTFTINKIKNYKIIPNVVNEEVFNYVKKDLDMRYNILSIRSYDTKKYANDIAVKAVLELSKRKNFKKYKIEFYGKGKLFSKTLKPLKKFNNIKIYETFLSQKEISEKHKQNGIFLVPTRQDAQGVSMCEAMSSGLIPITSNNTAIPEFVDNKTGFLTNNYKQIADAIEELANNEELFTKMSKEASRSIIEKCKREKVIKKEIELITK